MNAANAITLLRFIAIPPFIVLAWLAETRGTPIWAGRAAFGIYLAASISDFFDGWVARRFNLVTPLGRVLDPLADKLLSLACLLILARPEGSGAFAPLPVWFGALVIGREAWLGLGSFMIFWRRGPFQVRPHRVGKWTTALLFLLFSLALLGVPGLPLDPLVWLTAFGIATTIVLYTRDGIEQYRSLPPRA